MSKRIWKLTGEVAKKAACREILASDEGYVVTLAEPNRTLDQNSLLHPILTEISKQALWMGKKRPMLQWKTLMVSAHAVATGQPAEMTVGIEGEVVNLRESTAAMSKKRFSSLVEYVLSWCAENDILLPLNGGNLNDIDFLQGLHGPSIQQANRSAICSSERQAR